MGKWGAVRCGRHARGPAAEESYDRPPPGATALTFNKGRNRLTKLIKIHLTRMVSPPDRSKRPEHPKKIQGEIKMSVSIPDEKFFFTSESVTEGHPDKVADQISDSILDAIMAQDKHCRVACEALVTTGMAFIAGEITTSTYVEIPQIVRDTIKDIGYNSSKMGFDWQTCAVMTSIDHQSLDISMGVDKGNGLYKDRAGDQGRVRLRDRRDPGSCPCPSCWPTSCAGACPKRARTAPWIFCGRTARARSRSSTRAACPSASMPW
jgi:hypothetical protein